MTTTVDVEGDSYEAFPDPPRRGRRVVLTVLLVLIVLGLVVIAAAFVLYQREVNPAGEPGSRVRVTIPLGSSTQRIAAILDDRGVIGNVRAFRLYTRINGSGPFQAGEYTFRRNESFGKVVQVLDGGPEINYERLTVPEGLTLKQVAERVGRMPGRSGEKFLEVAASGQVRSKYQPAGSTNLEGLLLPETYNFEEKDDETTILKRMVQAFDDTCASLGCDQAQQKVGVSPYEAIVLASLVERETRFDDERAKVAEVIFNRLRRGELLGIDATVIYALGKSADRNVRVLFKDLEVNSPYNTYKVKGLPPTPIAAPGRESIEAALNPDQGPLLFYVVTETDGRHSFATTSGEHAANIRKAQQNGVR